MINYPNGIKKVQKQKEEKSVIKARRSFSSSNRGMSLENDINISNEFYISKDLCVITKRPTPINVVKVDYSKGAIITNAYFEKKSTTDYNGIYREKYVDFEAKSTRSKTSFPLANISDHQINHLKAVIRHGGIAFFIIELAAFDEVYLLDAKFVINCYEKGTRKSIPVPAIKETGYKIKKGYVPRLDYLSVVDEIYFKSHLF